MDFKTTGDQKEKIREPLLPMESHYGELLHPNNMQSDHETEDGDEKGCGFYFAKLDAEIIRPLLIYKYQREEMHRQDDLHELVRQNHHLIGSAHPGRPEVLARLNNHSSSAIDLGEGGLQTGRLTVPSEHSKKIVRERLNN